ncbi:hypothetical protein LCGC14_0688030 [marine sediment metagenome]|uniref:Uncharacterized protein n=1 Tax=marine sediment metagenome TaxID=412755 RepID=A0A0F9QL90_9ZZZZ
MTDCSNCGDREGKHPGREGKHRSLGGSILCHECAHELGLGHSHADHIHPLGVGHIGFEGVELKDHLALYLDEVGA